MITTTYYNVEEKVFNSDKGLGVWGWTNTTPNTKITDLTEAETMMAQKKDRWNAYLSKQLEKSYDPKIIDHLENLKANSESRIVEDVKVFTHVSEYCYTDVKAYEIIKVVSDKTIEVRLMTTKHNISHLTQHVGGYSAHTENQQNQKVTYSSDINNPVIRIRRKKNNPEEWTSNGSRFGLTEAPFAFHDFNF
jgi:dGTP triphosphohydrolase